MNNDYSTMITFRNKYGKSAPFSFFIVFLFYGKKIKFYLSDVFLVIIIYFFHTYFPFFKLLLLV